MSDTTRTTTTSGGDYAEGGIDSRSGAFVGRDQHSMGLPPEAVADAFKRLIDNAHHAGLRADRDEALRLERQAELDKQFAHIAEILTSIVSTQETLMRFVWILVIGAGGLTTVILLSIIAGLFLVIRGGMA
jgi:hypothetical protein